MDFLDELRDLPRRYMRSDGEIDYGKIAVDLGIETDEHLKAFLLQLYRLDATVNHYVNARLLYFFFGEKLKGKLPVLEVPPGEEVPWRFAERFCEGCPGSQDHEPVPGVTWPLCGSSARIERWESCGKYRENLRSADERLKAGDPEFLVEMRAASDETKAQLAAFEQTADELIRGIARNGATA